MGMQRQLKPRGNPGWEIGRLRFENIAVSRGLRIHKADMIYAVYNIWHFVYDCVFSYLVEIIATAPSLHALFRSVIIRSIRQRCVTFCHGLSAWGEKAVRLLAM